MISLLANALKFSTLPFNRGHWQNLDRKLPMVDRAFNKVRRELEELGLLADGVLLDQVDLAIAYLPSMGEAGYVYDVGVPFLHRLVGFSPGVIYLPSDVPHRAYVPGNTLTDTIRHEFAHAWRYLDPDFFDEDWFVNAFGSEYSDGDYCSKDEWLQKTANSRNFQKKFASCKTDAQRQQLSLQAFRAEFVSD